MRQGPNQRRSRGRGPRKPHLPLKQQTFDSNGPDVRVRGNAYQVLEKYLAMARDATSAGDRIAAENYLQHAEHYYRLINANADQQGPNGRHRHGVGRSPGSPEGNGVTGHGNAEDGGTPEQGAAPEEGGSVSEEDDGEGRPNGSA